MVTGVNLFRYKKGVLFNLSFKLGTLTSNALLNGLSCLQLLVIKPTQQDSYAQTAYDYPISTAARFFDP